MDFFSAFILKAARKLYELCFGKQDKALPKVSTDVNEASKWICKLLTDDKPCMIGRFGSTELNCVINYLGIKYMKHDAVAFVKHQIPEYWWNKNAYMKMAEYSGFFPLTLEHLSRFCEMMLSDMKMLDLLGSWQSNEFYLANRMKDVRKVKLLFLEPYWSDNPWTRALAGKKVLVVHPFAELIEKQYRENREKLFDNPDVLPLFKLQTLKAVQSLGGEDNGFRDWFEALQWMEDEIDKRDYDICLIGCGAYGFPLAAHVKRQGKKAVHLGGALQLLFGIRGKRWDDPNYGIQEFGKQNTYKGLFNQYWVYPGQQDKPECANNVENGCYW